MSLNRPNTPEKPAENKPQTAPARRHLVPRPNKHYVEPKPGEVVEYTRVKHTPILGNLKHLKMVQPGQVLNPKGRPKAEHCIADIIDSYNKMPLPYEMRVKLQKIMPEELLKNCTIRQALIYRALFDSLAFGDKSAREFWADRSEGKVSQPFSLGDIASSNTDDLMKLLAQNVKALQDANNAQ